MTEAWFSRYPPTLYKKKTVPSPRNHIFLTILILHSGLISRSEKDIVTLSIKRPAQWFSNDKRVHNPNAARFNPLIKLGQILSPAAYSTGPRSSFPICSSWSAASRPFTISSTRLPQTFGKISNDQLSEYMSSANSMNVSCAVSFLSPMY